MVTCLLKLRICGKMDPKKCWIFIPRCWIPGNRKKRSLISCIVTGLSNNPTANTGHSGEVLRCRQFLCLQLSRRKLCGASKYKEKQNKQILCTDQLADDPFGSIVTVGTKAVPQARKKLVIVAHIVKLKYLKCPRSHALHTYVYTLCMYMYTLRGITLSICFDYPNLLCFNSPPTQHQFL